MASADDIAKASIEVQMEASRIESAVVAGKPYNFDDLEAAVIDFKQVAQPDSPVDSAEG